MKWNIINAINNIIKNLTEDLPVWGKPFVRIIIIVIIPVLLILFYPYLLLGSFFYHRSETPCLKLKRDLENMWYQKSRKSALIEFRKIYNHLKENLKVKKKKKLKIEPFGVFDHGSLIYVTEYMYNYEVSCKCWSEALQVCQDYFEISSLNHFLRQEKWTVWDRIMNKSTKKGYKKILENHLETWLLNYAKCLYHTDGIEKAQEYLLSHMNGDKLESQIKRYLKQLQEEEQ